MFGRWDRYDTGFDYTVEPRTAVPGELVVFTIVVTNTSSGLPMTGVVVTAHPPAAYVELLSATAGGARAVLSTRRI